MMYMLAITQIDLSKIKAKVKINFNLVVSYTWKQRPCYYLS